MAAKIIFLLVPALVCANINVKVNVSNDQLDAKVEAFGDQVGIISERERDTFSLNEQDLKDAAEKYLGRRPDKVFVHSPTTGDDIYKLNDWDQVRTTLRPISAHVLGIKTNPVILAIKVFENSYRHPVKIGRPIETTIEQTVSIVTKKGGDITVGQEIAYIVNFAVCRIFCVGGSHLNFTNNWGETTTKVLESILSSASVNLELEPGQASKVVLSASKGTMEIEVDYEATLSGLVACNYTNPHKGNHFWPYDVNALLKAAGRPTNIRSKEIIKISFYANVETKVYDAQR